MRPALSESRKSTLTPATSHDAQRESGRRAHEGPLARQVPGARRVRPPGPRDAARVDPRRVGNLRRPAQRERQVGPDDGAEVADDRHAPGGGAGQRLVARQRDPQHAGAAMVDRKARRRALREPALGQQRPCAARLEQCREPVRRVARRAQPDPAVRALVVGPERLQPRPGAGGGPPRCVVVARARLPEGDPVVGDEQLEAAPVREVDGEPPGDELVAAALAGRRGVRLPHGVLDGRLRGGAGSAAERGGEDGAPGTRHGQLIGARVGGDRRRQRVPRRGDGPPAARISDGGRAREDGQREQSGACEDEQGRARHGGAPR
jgi:hypothetical protein